MTRPLALSVGVLCALAVGCGGGSDLTEPPPAEDPVNVTGPWRMTISNIALADGAIRCSVPDVSMSLIQSGTMFSGSHTSGVISCTGVDLPPVRFSSGPIINGAVSGDGTSVDLGFDFDDGDFRFTGTTDGATMSGTAVLTLEQGMTQGTFMAAKGDALPPPPPPPAAGPVTSLVLTPASATVPVGQTQFLAATLRDASGTVLTGRVVAWSSTAPAVASVSTIGIVTGQAVGAALVIATSEGKADTSAITVVPGAASAVTVSPSSAIVQVGASVQFTAVVTDGSGNPTGAAITWSTGSSSIATISPSGRATGKAAGTTTVTARSGTTTGTAQLVVTAPAPPPPPPPPPPEVGRVEVVPQSAVIVIGQVFDFGALVYDAQGNRLPTAPIEWTSSATAVATINRDGLVSALTAGTATITAQSGGKAGTAQLTVTPAVEATVTTVTSSSDEVYYGEGVTFTARVQGPGGPPGGTVQFFIDDAPFDAPAELIQGETSVGTVALTAGLHTVTARYSGAAGFAPSTGTLSGGQTIFKTGTEIIIFSDNPDPSANGEAVTVLARVNGVSPIGGSPGGTLTATSGGAQCVIVLTPGENGQCTLSPSFVDPLADTGIYFVYSGDANFQGVEEFEGHTIQAAP